MRHCKEGNVYAELGEHAEIGRAVSRELAYGGYYAKLGDSNQ